MNFAAKLFVYFVASAAFAPIAVAVLNQASQIVA